MAKLKKIELSTKSEATKFDVTKGSISNPYTQEEKALFNDESWPGGYVEGLGYLPPASFDGFDCSSESSGSELNVIILDGVYAELSQYTQNILNNLNYSGTIYVTSTARTPEHQAEVMLENIKRTSVQAQLAIYAEPGKKVIRTYNSQSSDAENIANMTAKIYEVGPQNVSHHCADMNVVNVFDVSKSRLSDVARFTNAIRPFALKVLDENNCIHVEIRQPQSA